MTIGEFKAFIEGMAVDKSPTEKQWALITEKMATYRDTQRGRRGLRIKERGRGDPPVSLDRQGIRVRHAPCAFRARECTDFEVILGIE